MCALRGKADIPDLRKLVSPAFLLRTTFSLLVRAGRKAIKSLRCRDVRHGQFGTSLLFGEFSLYFLSLQAETGSRRTTSTAT
jgi:hypothetical protein